MLVAISDTVWLQLIALGEHFVQQIIPALTLISTIVAVMYSVRNRSAIGQIQSSVNTKAEEIKDAGRAHAETAAVAAVAAVARDDRAVAREDRSIAREDRTAAREDRAAAELTQRINALQSSRNDTPN